MPQGFTTDDNPTPRRPSDLRVVLFGDVWAAYESACPRLFPFGAIPEEAVAALRSKQAAGGREGTPPAQ